jgi:methionyl-tRNA formyltransferase
MKVLVLTSSVNGMTAYAVPLLFNESSIKIAMVVLNEGQTINKKPYFKKKINKIFRIGLVGALNGIRMRKWFYKDAEKFLPVIDLEKFCRQHHIPFERTPSINCDITRGLLHKANAEIGISLGNSYISKSVFSIFPMGMINIHGEILPDYQNAQSIIWQLYNGSPETGFTIHKINNKIDQGDILYQEVFPIIFKETLAKTVSYNCAQITKKACGGLVKVLQDFKTYNANAKKQNKGNSYTTPSWKQFRKIQENFLILKSTNSL